MYKNYTENESVIGLDIAFKKKWKKKSIVTVYPYEYHNMPINSENTIQQFKEGKSYLIFLPKYDIVVTYKEFLYFVNDVVIERYLEVPLYSCHDLLHNTNHCPLFHHHLLVMYFSFLISFLMLYVVLLHHNQ